MKLSDVTDEYIIENFDLDANRKSKRRTVTCDRLEHLHPGLDGSRGIPVEEFLHRLQRTLVPTYIDPEGVEYDLQYQVVRQHYFDEEFLQLQGYINIDEDDASIIKRLKRAVKRRISMQKIRDKKLSAKEAKERKMYEKLKAKYGGD